MELGCNNAEQNCYASSLEGQSMNVALQTTRVVAVEGTKISPWALSIFHSRYSHLTCFKTNALLWRCTYVSLTELHSSIRF